MAGAKTGPDPGFWGKVQGVALDAARSRLIDVERPQDDNNIPDYTDVRTGNAQSQRDDALGGVFSGVDNGSSAVKWVIGGIGLLAVGGLIFAVVKS